jgi:MoaA/NifB/PqqE/SkfB family radical SAM enzyme
VSDLISTLPVVVLNVYSRCNCRCGMCDIWKATDSRELPVLFIDTHLDELQQLGVKWVVLTGGEPLMHSDLFSICDAVRSRDVRVTVLTSGLLIARYAGEIAKSVDDLIVSLDGPPDIHDKIRGVADAFESIRNGVSALREIRPAMRVAARCTVQRANHARLWDTTRAAAAIGIDSISFLAVDLLSTAFNRPLVWPEVRRGNLALTVPEIGVLEHEIERLQGEPIVADSADHLRRIVERFRAYAGLAPHEAPRCNAPWTSAVIEADGVLRPCFFHPPVATVNGSLLAALNSSSAQEFRSSLDISTNEICKRCVCSLFTSN